MLKLPYSQLIQQPAWWVEDMVKLISIKRKVEKDQHEAEQAKTRNKRH